jgi:hypothetical protein
MATRDMDMYRNVQVHVCDCMLATCCMLAHCLFEGIAGMDGRGAHVSVMLCSSCTSYAATQSTAAAT